MVTNSPRRSRRLNEDDVSRNNQRRNRDQSRESHTNDISHSRWGSVSRIEWEKENELEEKIEELGKKLIDRRILNMFSVVLIGELCYMKVFFVLEETGFLFNREMGSIMSYSYGLLQRGSSVKSPYAED